MSKISKELVKAAADSLPLCLGYGATKTRGTPLSHYYVASMGDETTFDGPGGLVEEGTLEHEIPPPCQVSCEIYLKNGEGERIMVGCVGLPEGGEDIWSGWIIGNRQTGQEMVVVSIVASQEVFNS